MKQMLSTIDNPFDPFDEFNQWFRWDLLHGYNSCGLLDRFSYTSPALPDSENSEELKRAMNEIVANDLTGMRIIVTKEAK